MATIVPLFPLGVPRDGPAVAWPSFASRLCPSKGWKTGPNGRLGGGPITSCPMRVAYMFIMCMATTQLTNRLLKRIGRS
eukprot:1795044-Amphidinium_carterae.1